MYFLKAYHTSQIEVDFGYFLINFLNQTKIKKLVKVKICQNYVIK